MPQTFDELMALALSILPNCELGEDNDGQIVIYTGCYQRASSAVLHDAPEDDSTLQPDFDV